jgi:hypothetical protein
MPKPIILTIPQYAKQLNKTRQSVLNAIKKQERGLDKSHLLPRLISFKKLGRDYIVTVMP